MMTMNTPHRAADMILINGDFRTQDPDRPVARAVAVTGNRIAAVGNDEIIKMFAGSKTEIIDLGGRLGLPGIIDSHFHYFDWALGRKQLDLSCVRSRSELLDRVRRTARAAPPATWILGQGWNESEWAEQCMPDRDALDAAAPSNPVALFRCDMHLLAANSPALTLAGIGDGPPGPSPDFIDRDTAGRPSGILRELAGNRIKQVIPPPDEEHIFYAMEEGIPVLHSLGITGLCDSRLDGGPEGGSAFTAWRRLRENGKLDLRCWVGIHGDHMDDAVASGFRTGSGDDCLRTGHLKFFADGSMGARTAWMLEPYLDAGCGTPVCPVPELDRMVQEADRSGFAVMIHAIGDRANREVIGIFERLAAARAGQEKTARVRPAVPHRIEHVQMIQPEDLARLARLNLAACVQPCNIISDIRMIDASVGSRGERTYTFRAMLDAGVRVIFSSDAPVCNPDPMLGIHAAVNRRRPDGTPEQGWYPEQRISVDEAVRAYTIEPARACGAAHELGSITRGKRADMIILDRNIYQVDPMDIVNAGVDITVFDGRIVYGRERWDSG